MCHVKMKLELRRIQLVYQQSSTQKNNNVMTVTTPLSESQNCLTPRMETAEIVNLTADKFVQTRTNIFII
jgi:hypothetical protein